MVATKTYTQALVASILLISPLALQAQQIKVNAPREYAAGRPFNITYSLSINDNDVRIVSNPNLHGLDLAYGPAVSTSSSVSYINGRMSSQSSTEVTYTVVGDQEGTYSVSGFKLRVGGKDLSAPAVTIRITGGGGNTQRSSSSIKESRGAEYHYQASVSKRSVYIQEPLPVVYTLSSTESPQINDVKPPSYDGFVSLDLLGNTQRQMRIERRGGRDWAVVDIMKDLLFPQHAGKLTIPSAEISVRYTLRDASGDPLLNQVVPRTYATSPIEITVKPLPEEGKPADFSGAVGSFNVRYETKQNDWKTNEATTLKIILEGQGNLKIAKLPKLSLSNDIELYDPVEHSDQSYNGGKLHSVRTIEYNLIPRKVGVVKIPSLSISYFNPATSRYETTATEALSIKVKQGKNENIQTTIHSGADGNDSMPSGVIDNDNDDSAFNPNLWQLILTHLIALVGGIIGLVYLKKHYSYTDDKLRVIADKAKGVAHKRLKTARQYLNDGNRDAFLEEILNSIWGYLGDKLRLPLSELNRNNITELLISREVSTEKVNELVALINQIEFARFAPQTEDNSSEHLYELVVEVIAHLENKL